MEITIPIQFKGLSMEAYYYLTADKADEISGLIATKYKFDWEGIKRLSELVKRLYLKRILPDDLPSAAAKLFNLDETKARQLACDIVGARLLPLESWFESDLKGLLTSWGGDAAKYLPHIAAMKKAVPEEMKRDQAALNEDIEDEDKEKSAADETDWEGKRNYLADTFGGQDLLELLITDDESLLREINADLIHFLASDPDLKTVFSSRLFANQTMLSSQEIVLDGKLESPTVGHWLEYFVRQKGANYFEMVAASDFVVNSDNAKRLSDDERTLLLKLLNIYRRVKFFPADLDEQNPQNWEMFSLPTDEKPLSEPRWQADTSAAIIAEAEPKVLISQEEKQADHNQDKINIANALKLQKMMDQYPEGSLERLAIEEELKKYLK